MGVVYCRIVEDLVVRRWIVYPIPDNKFNIIPMFLSIIINI